MLFRIPEAQDKRKAAYHLAQGPFKQALSAGMPRKFSEAKADVEKKVATMINVYKRFGYMLWLWNSRKAIVKLNVIKPYIGYPEELPAR